MTLNAWGCLAKNRGTKKGECGNKVTSGRGIAGAGSEGAESSACKSYTKICIFRLGCMKVKLWHERRKRGRE